MHIPDGFLDTKTILATSIFSLIGVGRAVRRLRRTLPRRSIPLMGLAAAFVFVAQMLNFPVVGGTSGHLLGAVLIAVLLGPNAAVFVMSVVLGVQCFLFADGGVLALGANIFNMAIIAPIVGYSVYRLVRMLLPRQAGIIPAAALASWVSTVIAAICCTGELAWSGTVQWALGFPAMAGIHMLIAIGEAIITSLVLVAVYQTRPDLLTDLTDRPSRPATDILLYGGLVTIGLVLFVSPFASPWPDGLEAVAGGLGFSSREVAHPAFPSPFADYQVSGIGSLQLATLLAGIVGAVVVFLASILFARIAVPRVSQDRPS